jgi:hypothetical protein
MAEDTSTGRGTDRGVSIAERARRLENELGYLAAVHHQQLMAVHQVESDLMMLTSAQIKERPELSTREWMYRRKMEVAAEMYLERQRELLQIEMDDHFHKVDPT